MSATSSVRLGTPGVPSGHILDLLERAGNVAQRFGGQMGVSRRRGQLGMAEQNLDHPNTRVSLKEMGREAMPERM